MLTPVDFMARSKEKVHTAQTDQESEKPKFARMSFDQVDDMHSEDLQIPIALQKLYAPIIAVYPGFKYIKEHIPIRIHGNLPI